MFTRGASSCRAMTMFAHALRTEGPEQRARHGARRKGVVTKHEEDRLSKENVLVQAAEP